MDVEPPLAQNGPVLDFLSEFHCFGDVFAAHREGAASSSYRFTSQVPQPDSTPRSKLESPKQNGDLNGHLNTTLPQTSNNWSKDCSNGHTTDGRNSIPNGHANGTLFTNKHPVLSDRPDDEPSTTLPEQPSSPILQNGEINRHVKLLTRRDWTKKREKIIMGPYDYVAAGPSKEFRTELIKAFNAWLHSPEESLRVISDVVRMLHNASLVIDDIQDNSQLRRGKPVAHSIFGIAQTINAGNYVYFRALGELRKLQNPVDAINIYAEEMLSLHRGQGMELYWRDTLECPEEIDYFEMATNKTGGLFRMIVRLMQSESKAGVDCVPLANVMGLVFQIADDYKNLTDLDYSLLKGLCEDLTEGKFSFPILHSIRTDMDNKELLNILRQRSTDAEVKKQAIRYLQSTDSLAYSKQVVCDLLEHARQLCAQIDADRGVNVHMYKVLDRLAVD